MDDTLKLLAEVEALSAEKLRAYMAENAEPIVRQTQGNTWDDPEDWQLEAVQLAHAVCRFLREPEPPSTFCLLRGTPESPRPVTNLVLLDGTVDPPNAQHPADEARAAEHISRMRDIRQMLDVAFPKLHTGAQADVEALSWAISQLEEKWKPLDLPAVQIDGQEEDSQRARRILDAHRGGRCEGINSDDAAWLRDMRVGSEMYLQTAARIAGEPDPFAGVDLPDFLRGTTK